MISRKCKAALQWTIRRESSSDLLHEDLRVVWHHVPVHHGSEGDVIACRLDVLVHQLPETLPPQAVHQLGHVPQSAANLPRQDLCVHQRPVVDWPAGDGGATLSDGPLEQAYGRAGPHTADKALREKLRPLVLSLSLTQLSSPWHTFASSWWGLQGFAAWELSIMQMLEEERL